MSLPAQFFRFGIVGLCGFFVDISVLYLMRLLGLDLYTARAVSFVVAATFTWFGNRLVTFAHDRPAGQPLATEWMRYVTAMTFGGAVNYGVYALLITFVPVFLLHPWLAVAAGTGAGLTINFVLARRILHKPA